MQNAYNSNKKEKKQHEGRKDMVIRTPRQTLFEVRK
jgi:hypothetical protein